jgi:DNA-binding MarR family transcriptional regulator
VVTSQPAQQARATGRDGLVDALAQAAFVTMAVLNKVGADNDLSLTQLRVLAILRDRRLRMTTLADYLGLEKSTMTGLVGRAEKRGLLNRAPNVSDGRAVDVFLSSDGAELAERLYTYIARSLSPMTSKLAPTEQRLLQTLLEQMLSPRDSASPSAQAPRGTCEPSSGSLPWPAGYVAARGQSRSWRGSHKP